MDVALARIRHNTATLWSYELTGPRERSRNAVHRGGEDVRGSVECR